MMDVIISIRHFIFIWMLFRHLCICMCVCESVCMFVCLFARVSVCNNSKISDVEAVIYSVPMVNVCIVTTTVSLMGKKCSLVTFTESPVVDIVVFWNSK